MSYYLLRNQTEKKFLQVLQCSVCAVDTCELEPSLFWSFSWFCIKAIGTDIIPFACACRTLDHPEVIEHRIFASVASNRHSWVVQAFLSIQETIIHQVFLFAIFGNIALPLNKLVQGRKNPSSYLIDCNRFVLHPSLIVLKVLGSLKQTEINWNCKAIMNCLAIQSRFLNVCNFLL